MKISLSRSSNKIISAQSGAAYELPSSCRHLTLYLKKKIILATSFHQAAKVQNASQGAFILPGIHFLKINSADSRISLVGPTLTTRTLNTASPLFSTQPAIHPHQGVIGCPEDRKELDPCGLYVLLSYFSIQVFFIHLDFFRQMFIFFFGRAKIFMPIHKREETLKEL